MIGAYQYRAFPDTPCEHRLALVVNAGVTAVQNAELPDERQQSLEPCAQALGISAADLRSMASIGERQKERVKSLAGRLTN